jgi:hypothetical protein
MGEADGSLFAEIELQEHIAQIKANGYPAIHHSKVHRRAYRVIGREYLE